MSAMQGASKNQNSLKPTCSVNQAISQKYARTARGQESDSEPNDDNLWDLIGTSLSGFTETVKRMRSLVSNFGE